VVTFSRALGSVCTWTNQGYNAGSIGPPHVCTTAANQAANVECIWTIIIVVDLMHMMLSLMSNE